jgi:hypothetical protein
MVVARCSFCAARAVRYLDRSELRSTFGRHPKPRLSLGSADPRPEAERRAALFDFVCPDLRRLGVDPQSVFDGSLATQAIVGDVDTIVGSKVGLVLWREQPDVPAFGMAPGPRADLPLRWTVNCLVCHTVEIDGVAYLGAGTKTFDDRFLGEALKTLTSERWRSILPADPSDRAFAADATDLNSHHHGDRL